MTYKLPLKYPIYVLALCILSGIYQLITKVAPAVYVDSSNFSIYFLNSLLFIGTISAIVYFVEKKKLLENRVPIVLIIGIVSIGILIDYLMV